MSADYMKDAICPKCASSNFKHLGYDDRDDPMVECIDCGSQFRGDMDQIYRKCPVCEEEIHAFNVAAVDDRMTNHLKFRHKIRRDDKDGYYQQEEGRESIKLYDLVTRELTFNISLKKYAVISIADEILVKRTNDLEEAKDIADDIGGYVFDTYRQIFVKGYGRDVGEESWISVPANKDKTTYLKSYVHDSTFDDSANESSSLGPAFGFDTLGGEWIYQRCPMCGKEFQDYDLADLKRQLSDHMIEDEDVDPLEVDGFMKHFELKSYANEDSDDIDDSKWIFETIFLSDANIALAHQLMLEEKDYLDKYERPPSLWKRNQPKGFPWQVGGEVEPSIADAIDIYVGGRPAGQHKRRVDYDDVDESVDYDEDDDDEDSYDDSKDETFPVSKDQAYAEIVSHDGISTDEIVKLYHSSYNPSNNPRHLGGIVGLFDLESEGKIKYINGKWYAASKATEAMQVTQVTQDEIDKFLDARHPLTYDALNRGKLDIVKTFGVTPDEAHLFVVTWMKNPNSFWQYMRSSTTSKSNEGILDDYKSNAPDRSTLDQLDDFYDDLLKYIKKMKAMKSTESYFGHYQAKQYQVDKFLDEFQELGLTNRSDTIRYIVMVFECTQQEAEKFLENWMESRKVSRDPKSGYWESNEATTTEATRDEVFTYLDEFHRDLFERGEYRYYDVPELFAEDILSFLNLSKEEANKLVLAWQKSRGKNFSIIEHVYGKYREKGNEKDYSAFQVESDAEEEVDIDHLYSDAPTYESERKPHATESFDPTHGVAFRCNCGTLVSEETLVEHMQKVHSDYANYSGEDNLSDLEWLEQKLERADRPEREEDDEPYAKEYDPATLKDCPYCEGTYLPEDTHCPFCGKQVVSDEELEAEIQYEKDLETYHKMMKRREEQLGPNDEIGSSYVTAKKGSRETEDNPLSEESIITRATKEFEILKG